jgi:hypothetical protein
MHLRLPSLSLGVLAAALLAPTPVSAQTAAGEAVSREAQRLLKAGRTHEACEKFAASQDMDPAIPTLLNLAACHEKEGRTATAFTEFSEAMSEAGSARDTKREATARSGMSRLLRILSRVKITVAGQTPGLEVKLDGQALPASSLATSIPLDPGEHTVEASADGYRPWSQRVNVHTRTPLTEVSVPALVSDMRASPPPPPEGTPPSLPASPPQTSFSNLYPRPEPITPPVRTRERESDSSSAFYTSPWFWGVVGAVVAVTVGVVAVRSVHKDAPCPDGRMCQ